MCGEHSLDYDEIHASEVLENVWLPESSGHHRRHPPVDTGGHRKKEEEEEVHPYSQGDSMASMYLQGNDDADETDSGPGVTTITFSLFCHLPTVNLKPRPGRPKSFL